MNLMMTKRASCLVNSYEPVSADHLVRKYCMNEDGMGFGRIWRDGGKTSHLLNLFNLLVFKPDLLLL